MKRSIFFLLALIVGLLSASAPIQMVKASPSVEISVTNLPSDDLVLGVGESQTFTIDITSSDHFILAMVMTDMYYPGRGVFWHGSDRAIHSDLAVLHLTITGKESTASLPGGVAPVAIVAGVRYQGGVVYSERFDFNVRVE
jgi:hypothetical protein